MFDALLDAFGRGRAGVRSADVVTGWLYDRAVAERRPWRSLDADLFRFTTTDLRELHLAVMASFEEAAVLAPALNLDGVRTALASVGWDEPIDDSALHGTLQSLSGWGLLEVTHDHTARYSTPEEFERKNLQWSLTARGEAAISGVLRALDSLRHAVGLQAAVLDAIGDGLAELAELASAPRSPAGVARTHLQLHQVEDHLSSLVVSVRQFNAHLQRLLRDDGSNDDVFLEVKRQTVNYLEEYVEGVERPQRRLLHGIERVEELGLAGVFDRALTGANLAPVAGIDPGPAWLADRERRWEALRAWFSPADASPALIRGLLDVARTAIIELLRVLERRWDRRRRSASVAHDFRALARLFAAAPGDVEGHALFAAAFGLWPARHAHLRSLDGEARAATTPWVEAEPVEVAPALRTTGTLTNTGRVHPVADPAALRAIRQRAQAEALAAHDGLRAVLLTDGDIRLAQFARLPVGAFTELLGLLAVALDATLGTDGARRAVSADGGVEVVLRDPGDGRRAVLATDTGTFTAPDLLVSIALTGALRVSSANDEEAAVG